MDIALIPLHDLFSVSVLIITGYIVYGALYGAKKFGFTPLTILAGGCIGVVIFHTGLLIDLWTDMATVRIYSRLADIVLLLSIVFTLRSSYKDTCDSIDAGKGFNGRNPH